MEQLLPTLWRAIDSPFPIFLLVVAIIAIACALWNKEGALITLGFFLIVLGLVLPLSSTRDIFLSLFPHTTVAVLRLLNAAQNPQFDSTLIVIAVIALLRALRNREGFLIIYGLALISFGIGLAIQVGLSKTFLTIMKETSDVFKLADLTHSAPLPAFLIVAGFTAIIWALRNKPGTLITAAILLIIVTTFGIARF